MMTTPGSEYADATCAMRRSSTKCSFSISKKCTSVAKRGCMAQHHITPAKLSATANHACVVAWVLSGGWCLVCCACAVQGGTESTLYPRTNLVLAFELSSNVCTNPGKVDGRYTISAPNTISYPSAPGGKRDITAAVSSALPQWRPVARSPVCVGVYDGVIVQRGDVAPSWPHAHDIGVPLTSILGCCGKSAPALEQISSLACPA